MQYVCNANRSTSQKKHRIEVKSAISNEARQILVQFVCASTQNRRMSHHQIVLSLNWNVFTDVIRNALKKEEFSRHIARRKSSFSEINRFRRLEWAWEHLNWIKEQWMIILWNDEIWINDLRHNNTWVIKRVHEEFDETCLNTRLSRFDEWMFWACFVDKKKARVYFEKKIENRSIKSVIANVWCSSYTNEFKWIRICNSCKTMHRIMQLMLQWSSLKTETYQSYFDSHFLLIWTLLKSYEIIWKIEFNSSMRMKIKCRTIKCVKL